MPQHSQHDHPSRLLGWLRHLVARTATTPPWRSTPSSRPVARASGLAVSFAALAVTAVLQAVVVWRSSSVALLGDTLHNLADALTAVPLAVAFTLGRRAATRRYTYGYGRAEDLAGSSSWPSSPPRRPGRLPGGSAPAGPGGVRALGLVAAAAVIGFAGNELVARYRIRVGREIGSAALVADGLHARTDGLSLSVLGAAGVALGFPLADPLVGLLITAAILVVLRDAAREVYRRLMDASTRAGRPGRGRAAGHPGRARPRPGPAALDRSYLAGRVRGRGRSDVVGGGRPPRGRAGRASAPARSRG